jgi:predicted Ser/Thr protein kinase
LCLFGVFAAPPVFDALGDAVFPPKKTGLFFRMNHKRQSEAEALASLLTVLFWIGTIGSTTTLAWLELPRVAARRTEWDTAPEKEAPSGAAPLSEALAPTIITGGVDSAATISATASSSPSGAGSLSTPNATKDRYVIEAELGRGGMGVVYRARDLVLDRLVALKALSPGLVSMEATASRFRQEARVLARLTHPHIVQIYDFIETEDALFIAMELVHGHSLADHVAKVGPMTLQGTIELSVPLAEAMAYAHEQGVLHRDFKPHNVLLTTEMVPKITDFGLAKATEAPDLTQTGAIMGSPAYMSPEQATCQAVGPTSDIYSFGVTLYQMLSGRTPFTGGVANILIQHVSQAPTPLSELVPELPLALDELMGNMLAKDPAQRISTMKEVAQRLRAICF